MPASRHSRAATVRLSAVALLLAATPALPIIGARAVAQARQAAPASARPAADTVSRVLRSVTSASPTATRAELTAALEAAERTAAGGSGGDRSRADAEAVAIRNRLRQGDFRAGDRLGMSIAGDTTLREVPVREGVQIDLPFGAPPLALPGVLRSELSEAVLAHLRKYVRDPDVRVWPLQRVGVTGSVSRPGVYWVQRDLSLSELVMRAGGPTPNARLEKARVVRGGREVIDEQTYARLAREGQTVEESGIQAGDELRVPERVQRNWTQIASYAFFGVSALTALLALVRASYQ